MFTALVPPQEVLEDLEDFLEPRREADPAVRFTPVESWHVTTAFAGSVPEGALARLAEALLEVANRTPAIEASLGGAGCFPHPAAAKTLYLDVAPAEPLGRLAAACRSAFVRAGVEVDGARFVPHLTLARANRRFSATRWLRVVDAAVLPGWVADELVLIESHLRDRGSRYQVRARLPLAGPDAGVRDPSPTTPPTA